MMDEATLAQVRAADPAASTWLSANAGSGKTKVLTDRVARLLLHETPPQRILCLTYTKAAASEMQNRLFKRLGEWAMLPDEKLIDELKKMGEPIVDERVLARARRLFARAIETPGGLKIQTIHAFCSSLLRRFPLEASVSPDFAEVDERSLQQLRTEVFDRFAQSPEAAGLQRILGRLSDDGFAQFLSKISKYRDEFSGEMPDLHALFDLPRGYDEDAIRRATFTGDEAELLSRIAPNLIKGGGVNDIKLAAKLQRITAFDVEAIPALAEMFLYKSGANEGRSRGEKIVTKAGKDEVSDADQEALIALGERVEEAWQNYRALHVLRRTEDLHRFARQWIPAFDHAKTQRGWLDFDDLIRLTRRLLEDSTVAQWVLFKLDGGIDHILVDEAQDTSPEQWKVVDLLTQEFTAGLGARHETRTIFVVGDRKQSIYSFQGADLRGFGRSHDAFRARLAQVGQHLQEQELRFSFRSSDAVLRAVDQCFAADLGDNGLGGAPSHAAFWSEKPGRVDLWPVVPKPEKPDEAPWYKPVDSVPVSDPAHQLADHIAANIRAIIDRGEQIMDRDTPRPVHEGDFLILVQRRKLLFHALIRACKAQGLEVAGADLLKLGEELAVKDLLAVLRFLALPEDDLSLAQALRSPLFGWTEDQLYRAAQGRGEKYLWEFLRNTAKGTEAIEILNDLRGQVDFLRPYELIERILTRHDGRRRMRARFGVEVDDALDAFVDLSLTYEAEHIPTLDGFLGWIAASDAEIKRQAAGSGHRLRVMTVHGSKGLEAPIVILPETTDRKIPDNDVVEQIHGTPYVPSLAAMTTQPQLDAKERSNSLVIEERDRLLYVAMTRAESWLIVAGAGESNNEANWHNKVSAAMERLPCVPLNTPTGQGLRFEVGRWPDALGARQTAPKDEVRAVHLPPLPPTPRRDVAATPSRLGGAKALPGAGDDTETAMERGTRLHRLLEELPKVPRTEWHAVAASTLMEMGVSDNEALIAEALSVLESPGTAGVFAEDALVEVSLSGDWMGSPLWGTVDRLLIDETRVLAVDFKSNRMVPERAEDVPEGLLRQMGAYAHLLAQVYPEKRIETALLWTARAELMMLPAALTTAALSRAALDREEPAS